MRRGFVHDFATVRISPMNLHFLTARLAGRSFHSHVGEKEKNTINEVVNKVTNDKAHEVKDKGQKHAGRIEKRYGGAKGAIRKND
jgi:hypothetical protein